MEVLEIPDDDDSSPTGATGAGEVQDASTSGIRSPQVEDAFSSRMRLCSRCKEPQEVLKGKLLICLHSFCEPCLDKLLEMQGSTHTAVAQRQLFPSRDPSTDSLVCSVCEHLTARSEVITNKFVTSPLVSEKDCESKPCTGSFLKQLMNV